MLSSFVQPFSVVFVKSILKTIWHYLNVHYYLELVKVCNSMPLGAAWAYYGKVLVLTNAAS